MLIIPENRNTLLEGKNIGRNTFISNTNGDLFLTIFPVTQFVRFDEIKE